MQATSAQKEKKVEAFYNDHPFPDFNLDKYNLPRNCYEKTYEANGIIDIYKTKNILKNTLLGNNVLPFKVKDFNSEIDDINDFFLVETFVKLKKIKI